MNPSNRKSYVDYRMKKANETFDVALLLFENGRWNSVVNRLYYACFYAVGALLVMSNIEAKSHSGVKTRFFLNFVKTKEIDLVFGKLYSDLFDWRQKGDYGDFFDFKEEEVKILLEPCKELIGAINEIIEQNR